MRDIERQMTAWDTEEQRQQKPQCEGHKDVKGGRREQRGAQNIEIKKAVKRQTILKQVYDNFWNSR